METAMIGWLLASFQFGTFVGGVVVYILRPRRAPEPSLRPYQAPTMKTWDRNEELPEEQLRERAQASVLMLDEGEIRDLTMQIMAETGVDEGAARKEVELILAEAGAIGQQA